MIIFSCPCHVENGVWRYFKEYSSIVSGCDFVDVKQLVNKLPSKTSLIILGGGWCDDYSVIASQATANNIPVGLVFHSPFGQMDTCNEVDHLAMVLDLIDQGVLTYLFFAEEQTTNAVKELVRYDLKDHIIYLPTSMVYKSLLAISTNTSGNIGLFGSSNNNKNILNQLIAAGLSKHKLVTNAIKYHRHYEKVINRLEIDVDAYSWLTTDDYKKMINSVQVGLQCSWSEAFDYVAAELSLVGVPVVTGPTINWNLPELIVANIDDPYEIAKKIDYALNLKQSDLIKVQKNIMMELDKRNAYIKGVFNQLVQEVKHYD